MIYLIRLIIWLIVIILISWGIHKILNKYISNEKLKPFIGVIAFLVIVLTPITIAKVAQVYYCWKYQPFYEIIKPLGDDFEGFYGAGLDYVEKYPTIVKYVDNELIIKNKNGYTYRAKEEWLGDKVKDINKSLIHKDDYGREIVYVREFIDTKGSKYCDKPNRKIMGKAFWRHYNSYFKQNKCIAKKIIHESKVSRYKIGGKALEDKKLIIIPGIAYVNYHKSPVFTDRITGEHYAWGAFISVKWDLYGAFNWWGGGVGFYCSYDFNLEDKLIKQVGEKNGN